MKRIFKSRTLWYFDELKENVCSQPTKSFHNLRRPAAKREIKRKKKLLRGRQENRNSTVFRLEHKKKHTFEKKAADPQMVKQK